MKAYYFFRHGKADAQVDDLTRLLTEKGIEQTQKQSDALAGASFDLVVCSSAKRTQHTADLLLGSARPPRVISDNLWQPKDLNRRASLDQLVQSVSGDTLADYLPYDRAHDYEHHAADIVDEIVLAVKQHQAHHTLIVGHAIILNAIGALLAPTHKDFLSHLKLSASDGFALTPGETARPILFQGL